MPATRSEHGRTFTKSSRCGCMCQVHPLLTIKLTPSTLRAGSRRRRWRAATSTRAGGDGGTSGAETDRSERTARAGARGDEEAGGCKATTSDAWEVDEKAAALPRGRAWSTELRSCRGRNRKASVASSGSAENNAASRAMLSLKVERATANASSNRACCGKVYASVGASATLTCAGSVATRRKIANRDATDAGDRDATGGQHVSCAEGALYRSSRSSEEAGELEREGVEWRG
eukprot:3609314-Pleurochrysis_carterae.AAC.3